MKHDEAGNRGLDCHTKADSHIPPAHAGAGKAFKGAEVSAEDAEQDVLPRQRQGPGGRAAEDYNRPGTGMLGGGSDGAGQEEDMIRLKYAGQVVKDLERAGYHVVVFNFEAAAVGAWHRRSRVFFAGIDETVSDTESKRQQRERTRGEQIGGTRSCAWKSARCGFVCDTMCQGLQDWTAGTIRKPRADECPERSDWWAAEPDVGRVAHGIPNRVDRLKCLGNAVVPQQAYPIFKALREEVLR